MIDITPRSSPGELIGVAGSYHRETATESDTERDYAPNQRTMHHHQHQHQHVPTHSAFGDPMDGELTSRAWTLERQTRRQIQIIHKGSL